MRSPKQMHNIHSSHMGRTGYPPHDNAQWARLESSVNSDGAGNPDPYFVSIDLATARHPQTLLSTQQNGGPLTVEHGAPLRLVASMKIGLKNIKAITRISSLAEEQTDSGMWSGSTAANFS
jgi:DMSO/TMAO reductase YedYZ molybdopterin-dependent catalytic subunit